jgi:hypothetical protein
MREVEFLPAWYPAYRRRRALVVTQTWATAVLIGAIGLGGVAAHQRVMAYESESRQLREEMQRTHAELKLLGEQLDLQDALRQQQRILAEVGLQVDVTRLLAELEGRMGPDVALLEFAADTEETVRRAERPAPGVAQATTDNSSGRAGVKSANPSIESSVDRKLKIRLVGVAPSDVDVANLLAGLTNKPLFDQVAMNYARERVSAGRVMREFELSFLINLNTPSAE